MATKRVLMIDNDQFSLSVLHRLVSELGYEPLVCSTSDAACTLIDGEGADIIIYNQDLEVEWGLALFDRLRTSRRMTTVPIILLSQGKDRFGPRFDVENGKTVCFRKPIAIEPFVSLFRELLDEQMKPTVRLLNC